MVKMKTVASGIRQKPNGDYVVTKSIKGERHYFTTSKLPEAKRWHRDFRPLPQFEIKRESSTVTVQMNGRDDSITFGDVWKKYQRDHLSIKSPETQIRVTKRLNKFTQSLTSLRMCLMNSDVIEAVINERKILTRSELRCNFDKELKMLNQVFEWHMNHADHKFKSPIERFHKLVGQIKPIPKKPKHIKEEELALFFRQLSGIWKQLAFMQMYMAGRIQEVAGLKPEAMLADKIKVSNVLTWINGRPVNKEETKTGEVSFVFINEHMREIITDLESKRPKDCPYLFHVDGQPLRYSWIQAVYTKAFKDAGLPYRGSHILRYGMAGIGGNLLGDNGSKAVTRHGSMAMARKYRGKPTHELTKENEQIVIYAGERFKKEA